MISFTLFAGALSTSGLKCLLVDFYILCKIIYAQCAKDFGEKSSCAHVMLMISFMLLTDSTEP